MTRFLKWIFKKEWIKLKQDIMEIALARSDKNNEHSRILSLALRKLGYELRYVGEEKQPSEVRPDGYYGWQLIKLSDLQKISNNKPMTYHLCPTKYQEKTLYLNVPVGFYCTGCGHIQEGCCDLFGNRPLVSNAAGDFEYRKVKVCDGGIE